MNIDMVVEIPKGSRIKYEIDHETGRLRVDRVLFTSMQYPAHYGYIEDTLGEDGDPLDVMVLFDYDVIPGCVIEVRPVALFNMVDDGGPDAKVLAVPTDIRWDGIQDLGDVPQLFLDEVEHFFKRYKDLEPGKFVKTAEWEDKAAAEKEIKGAFKRFQASKPSLNRTSPCAQ